MNRALKRGFGIFAISFGCSAMFTLSQADLIINATDSLRSSAFLVYEWPLVKRRGAVIAADMPPLLAKDYGEHSYVKVIRGIPGDEISVNLAGETCVAGYCAPLMVENGKPWSPAIAVGVIPDGHYAVFGTAADSLDSRYGIIGLIPDHTIRATGFAIPFPEWEALVGWL